VAPESGDPALAAQRAELAGARGVRSAVGAGTLLWAEASDENWHATVEGERLERSDAFGWTNAYRVPSEGRLDLSYDGGARRVLPWLQLVLWAAAAVTWFRTRERTRTR
jgi:hypothetical protein